MEETKTTAITPLSNAPPLPAPIVIVQPHQSYPLEHQPRTVQPTATRGAIALLTVVLGVGVVLIGIGLLAIALRPAPVPVVTPPPVQVNPNCRAFCGGGQ